MKIYVDIDDTICTKSEDLDYKKAQPLKKNIKKEKEEISILLINLIKKISIINKI